MMIVDDEIIEQRVLQKMVLKFCPFIRLLPCASNGVELLSCVEELQPDILVLDINMPILNGLDVLEVLKMKKIRAKILVVSAYSKFQYAQKAVNMGVDGYILKPVNEQVFAEAIQKLCMDLEHERKESSERGNLENLKLEYKKILENEIISDVLLGEINAASMKKYIELYNHTFCGGGTCIIKGENTGQPMDEEEMERLLEQLDRFCTCFGKKYKNFYAVCFLPDSDEPKDHYESWVRELFGLVQKKLPFLPWNTLVFGISSWKDAFAEFPAAMRESRIAVQGIGQGGFYSYCEPQERAEEHSYHREFYACRCLFRFDMGEEEKNKLQYSFHKIWKKTHEPELLRVFAFALLCTEKRGVNDVVLFEGAYGSLNHWLALRKLNTLEEIWAFVCRNSKETDQPQAEKEENSYVEKCICFLEGHYAEKISLESVADMMGISSFYLSRLFKQEIGRTFTEVLTNIRIFAALDQMWRGSESFPRIAERVGYDDVSYFYKVFKKKLGITASEMRRQLRRIL